MEIARGDPSRHGKSFAAAHHHDESHGSNASKHIENKRQPHTNLTGPLADQSHAGAARSERDIVKVREKATARFTLALGFRIANLRHSFFTLPAGRCGCSPRPGQAKAARAGRLGLAEIVSKSGCDN
jgi:hypothetical protein